MGASSSSTGLDQVTERAAKRVGQVAVSGRYNRLPKRIEDDYNLEKRKVLGTGYNGAVFMAKSKTSERKFAVKEFRLQGVTAEKKEELETEAEIFLSMDHPHVARLVDVFECDHSLNLVMECMEGGELFDRVREKKTFSNNDAAYAVYQMLLAINYIHKRGVVHRDLKLENFLYESKGSDHLKLIDFGFSHIWEPNTTMALSCGTLSYVAPEVLRKKYTSQCDMWSLGVITFILVCGYMPFSGAESAQVKAIKEGSYKTDKTAWRKLSSEPKEFVKKLLVVNEKERLTAEQALAEPWIVKHQESAGGKSEGIDTTTVEALCSFAQASQFKRACMSVMAWSLTNEERILVRDAFLEMDKDNTGVLTVDEFKDVLTRKFQINNEEAKKIFDAVDTAKNEEIHYTEFLAAMVSTRISVHDEMLSKAFKRFDVDGNGLISMENLQSVLGESFSGAEVEKLMQEADTSKDGQISYPEFIAYLKADANSEHQLAATKIIDDQIKKSSQDEQEAARELKVIAEPAKPKPAEKQKSSACVLL